MAYPPPRRFNNDYRETSEGWAKLPLLVSAAAGSKTKKGATMGKRASLEELLVDYCTTEPVGEARLLLRIGTRILDKREPKPKRTRTPRQASPATQPPAQQAPQSDASVQSSAAKPAKT